ncbi:ABC transporter ATP-binding protein [Propylenella binzhouense]|uniref:ABC transporter ATP-binding protein n=1 Tax=Propylenella binzhouense TaxID=2555902 RepID=A0A964WUC1_9HYPH|nr:ABC transporter ATP-binding protein [Propylenella binzhouense]MYZ48695.1 ABC transporter ATP-binding protein [Propylenella binzhouense]
MAAPAIELVGIDKSFGAVHANRNIALTVEKGTIHGIVGENGAGKSTLMSILYGFYHPDAGEIRIDGRSVQMRSPQDAIAAGIGMVHQHFMLVEPFTVLENVMLGSEGGALLRQGIRNARATLEAIARDFGLFVDPDAVVGSLPVGLQQRVEILKALYRGAETLILDEPTGVLTPAEADQLFDVLRQLRAQGKTVVLITHKLREIMAVTNRVSVMRRGEMVATMPTAEAAPERLAELMVGRRVLLRAEKETVVPGRPLLGARDLALEDERGVTLLSGITFEVRAGEIVGIAGVAGNGQSELMEVIAGMRPATGGALFLDGREIDLTGGCDAAAMRRIGLAHVPEDRHRTGLVMPFEECDNAILGYHRDPRYGSGWLMDRRAVEAKANQEIAQYDIRPPDCRLPAANFSGGNQQKIVLGRELERDPAVLVVGQPTRGVDIGAIEFIHRRLLDMRAAGKAILLVSVELDEIRALSDRILVMCGGRIVGERTPAASETELGLLMAGADRAAA